MIKKISREALNYMKCRNLFIGLLLLALNISACSSQTKTLNGKYISAYDSDVYYEFDGNKWNGLTGDDFENGTFVNKDGKITLYYNGDENSTCEMGYLYGEYICYLYEGNLPDGNYKESYISRDMTEGIRIECYFKEDKTYEEEVISDGEIVRTEHGTYTVSGDKVVCTSEDDVTTTYISAEDNIFFVQFVKE